MPLRLPRVPDFSPPPIVDRAIAAGELAEDLSEVEIQEWLEPIGNTGFYQSPLEAVDPYDCERWPDSPFCEGSQPFNPDFINLVPIITRNACETCLTIAPTLARLSLPPYTICKRSDHPDCVARPTNPDFGKIPDPEDFPREIKPVSYNNKCANGETFELLIYGGVSSGDVKTYIEVNEYWQRWHSSEGQATQGQRVGSLYLFNELYKRGMSKPNAQIYGLGSEYDSFVQSMNTDSEIHHGVYPYFGAYFIRFRGKIVGEANVKFRIKQRGFYAGVAPYQLESCIIQQAYGYEVLNPPCDVAPPRIDPIAPPYRPNERCCMACCDSSNAAENTELLRLIAKRLGTDQYPASVPKSLLTDRGEGQQEIESLTQLLGWFVNQVDALVGQFPVEIQVTDTDPTKKGDQSEKVIVPNIAEAIAEMYGLALKNSVDSDVAVSFLMRLASEVIATKNATLITQDYAKANAQFLGYKGNSKKRRIPYAFNPEGLDSLETILKESEKFIVGWEAQTDDTLLDYQQRLMFAAGIIKAVFFRGQKNLDQVKREVNNLVDGPEDEDSEERWREYLRALNNEGHRFNSGNVPKPKIKNLQTPQDITKLPTQDPSQK